MTLTRISDGSTVYKGTLDFVGYASSLERIYLSAGKYYGGTWIDNIQVTGVKSSSASATPAPTPTPTPTPTPSNSSNNTVHIAKQAIPNNKKPPAKGGFFCSTPLTYSYFQVSRLMVVTHYWMNGAGYDAM